MNSVISYKKRSAQFHSFLVKLMLIKQRLSGATLLVFANKQDIGGSMSLEEIRDVSFFLSLGLTRNLTVGIGTTDDNIS
jgi:signal recognition particle receptor subunit beta